MKRINTTDAVGHVLCHDITRIVKDVVKDTAFRKGHVVTEEDIPVLLSLGKDHLYIWEKDENTLHENEAAEILRQVCQNEHMTASPVKEGKIELSAQCDGLFQIDTGRLNAINEIDEIMIASRHTNTAVKKGDKLLGTRVIPLVIGKEKLEQVRQAAGEEPLARLVPFKKWKAGIVTTGSEVFYGRIQDTFTPVIVEKLAAFGIEVCTHITVNDDKEKITASILSCREQGADMIVCTGGMSVDPDDLTPGAIRDTGARIVTYGAPVLPGAMFLLGYFEDGTPVMGLPGCVMYAKATIFDLVLPRIAAGVPVTKKELAHLGNGGLCLGCEVCHYPNCGFGKGV
ncbi:MAG: molybdopterin-binding protein [Lachnospiraceae bacterium]|jgi:molybdenum cofactor synthesis domain-containing protein|nr:molybdopterin-binding protein [Lachnospiraceae bacterium]